MALFDLIRVELAGESSIPASDFNFPKADFIIALNSSSDTGFPSDLLGRLILIIFVN
jgi:hypothetical protein